MQEAADYHLTPRAEHPNAQNKMLLKLFGAWVGFDAFDLVETLLTQPLLAIAGDEAGSLLAQPGALCEGSGRKGAVPDQGRAAHMDLYDGKGAAKAAVNKMVAFFKSNLAPAKRG